MIPKTSPFLLSFMFLLWFLSLIIIHSSSLFHFPSVLVATTNSTTTTTHTPGLVNKHTYSDFHEPNFAMVAYCWLLNSFFFFSLNLCYDWQKEKLFGTPKCLRITLFPYLKVASLWVSLLTVSNLIFPWEIISLTLNLWGNESLFCTGGIWWGWRGFTGNSVIFSQARLQDQEHWPQGISSTLCGWGKMKNFFFFYMFDEEKIKKKNGSCIKI